MSSAALPSLCNIFSGVSLTPGIFGCLKDPDHSSVKHQIQKFTWQNNQNVSVEVINYGATITKILLPDKHNNIVDIVQGYDSLNGYMHKENPYHGATIGRVCNRIRDGTFKIGNDVFNVTRNFKNHQLHGGFIGFNKVIWKTHMEGSRLVLTYLSKDGEEGFPGDVLVTVQMELMADNEFVVEMTAVSTRPTPVNLTNHTYFNLAGHESGPTELKKHRITINSNKVTETDCDNIPTGAFRDISNTPLDLQCPSSIGAAMKAVKSGFDHNYVVNGHEPGKIKYVANVFHSDTGRVMEVYSDQPGIQFYTGNNLACANQEITDLETLGKHKGPYTKFSAFCLETQNYPNAVNIPHFPNSILYPGKIYRHNFSYKFRIQE